MGLILSKVRYFFIISFLFILLGLCVLLLNNKLDLHLWINQFHNNFFDVFFKNLTIVGDGAFALILLPYLVLFKNIRVLLISFLSCFLAGMFAQFFKKVIFPDMLRPGALINQDLLHIVDGVNLHTMHAFPSGHTTTSFAFFAIIAFLNKEKISIQIVCAISAILAGFSRVYLSQHFVADITFGAFLGISAFLISFQIMQYFNSNKLSIPLYDLIFANNKRMLSFRESLRWRKP